MLAFADAPKAAVPLYRFPSSPGVPGGPLGAVVEGFSDRCSLRNKPLRRKNPAVRGCEAAGPEQRRGRLDRVESTPSRTPCQPFFQKKFPRPPAHPFTSSTIAGGERSEQKRRDEARPLPRAGANVTLTRHLSKRGESQHTRGLRQAAMMLDAFFV